MRATLALVSADPTWGYFAMLAFVNSRRATEALRHHARRDTTTVLDREWQAWDAVAADAYHMLGRFEEELALARDAKAREPRYDGHWTREVSALAALGRTAEEPKITVTSGRPPAEGSLPSCSRCGGTSPMSSRESSLELRGRSPRRGRVRYLPVLK